MHEQKGGLPSISLSRRDFLILGGMMAAGLAAEGVTTPEASGEQQRPYPSAGWLETAYPDRPPLLEISIEGRNPLETRCRFFALRAPEVRQALYYAYDEAFDTTYDSPPRLGDLLAKHVIYAKRALHDIYNDTEPALANAAHVATYTLATYLSPYLRMEDVGGLSDVTDQNAAPLSNRFSPTHSDRHAEDYFYSSLPRLFPVKPFPSTTEADRVDRYVGWDRSVHAASHMFLTGQYYYSRLHNLQDATRITRAAAAHIAIATCLSPTNEARALALSRLAGTGWEIQESGKYVRDLATYYWHTWFSGEPTRFPFLRGLSFIDPLVEKDYQANDLGAHMGIAVHRPDLTGQTLERTIALCNADNLYSPAEK